MSSQVTNYQCPACTGPLRFVGSSGKLQCEHCNSSYTASEVEALYAAKELKAETDYAIAGEKAEENDWGADASTMKAYNCPSCGAELICDATTAATSCPYCGNPSIVPGQFMGISRPDFIIPFKLDKPAAVLALKEYYKGKKFLPNSFITGNHVEEIRGIYVPFWLFDAVADADIIFTATNSRTHKEGTDKVTVTDHYNVRRAGKITFENIPVDASTKMPDNHMDAIEPFDYGELQAFSTAYLPGYLADKYDVSIEESAVRANERISGSARESMRADVSGYERCTISQADINIQQGEVQYALMPVWLLCTKWEGKNYLFAMNGQTGRLVGDLPVSKGKVAIWFTGIAISTAVIASLALLFF